MTEPAPRLDIARNRAARNYGAREWAARAAWAAGRWLFRASPPPCHAWRALLLRVFGARVGRHVRLAASARIRHPWNLALGDWCAVGEDARIYNLGKIDIGARATVSQGAHLCAGTHDPADPAMRLLKPPVTVGPDAWVCADAFVGPGVTVGAGAVVAARAVAVRDVPPWTVAAGNPARVVKPRVLRPEGAA